MGCVQLFGLLAAALKSLGLTEAGAPELRYYHLPRKGLHSIRGADTGMQKGCLQGFYKATQQGLREGRVTCIKCIAGLWEGSTKSIRIV